MTGPLLSPLLAWLLWAIGALAWLDTVSRWTDDEEDPR